MVSFGVGAGISVGQAVAGYLGPTFGWRLPFLVISIPAIICAGVVYFTVKDPERGSMDRAFLGEVGDDDDEEGGVALVSTSSTANFHSADDDDIASLEAVAMATTISPANSSTAGNMMMPSLDRRRLSTNNRKIGNNNSDPDLIPNDPLTEEYFDNVLSEHYQAAFCSKDWTRHLRTTLKLLSTPTVVLSLIQGAPGCIPWGIINVFLNDYLSEDRGFSVETATTTLMLFSVGYAIGLVIGGVGGRYLYQLDIRLPALLAGSTAIIGCFPLWYLLNNVDRTTPYIITASSAMVAGVGAAPTGPIIKATLTNVTHPRARGQAFALFNLFDDFGKGLGPFFVSLLIVKFGGRLHAFNLGVFGWIICGVANLAIFFTVAKDERAIQMAIAAEIRTTSTVD
jgi:predicted MFS family arabinose efflux permease